MFAVTCSVPPVTRKLIIGLAVSAAVHLLIVLGISPRNANYVPPLPLQVELRREAPPERAGLLTTQQSSARFAERDAVTPAAASAQHPVPLPAAATSGTQSALPPLANAPLQLPLPLDKYYTAREVDVRAEQINEVNLVYPQLAYQMRVKGKVVLRIFINEQGDIDDVVILQASPTGTFEETALTATLALRFKPAIKDGRNVKSLKTIEVTFDPYESISIP